MVHHPAAEARSQSRTDVSMPLGVALTLALAVVVGAFPSGGAAQDAPAPLTAMEDERAWWNVWSRPSPERRIIVGMRTTHLNREDDGWQDDGTVGLIYGGFFGVTFRTTHGARAYSLGAERSWISRSAGPVTGMIGFRTGLVYGYDRQLGWAAEKYPILPFAQPILYARVGPFATDVTYTWVVVSVTAALRF